MINFSLRSLQSYCKEILPAIRNRVRKTATVQLYDLVRQHQTQTYTRFITAVAAAKEMFKQPVLVLV
jgi:hypothetical protein